MTKITLEGTTYLFVGTDDELMMLVRAGRKLITTETLYVDDATCYKPKTLASISIEDIKDTSVVSAGSKEEIKSIKAEAEKYNKWWLDERAVTRKLQSEIEALKSLCPATKEEIKNDD